MSDTVTIDREELDRLRIAALHWTAVVESGVHMEDGHYSPSTGIDEMKGRVYNWFDDEDENDPRAVELLELLPFAHPSADHPHWRYPRGFPEYVASLITAINAATEALTQ